MKKICFFWFVRLIFGIFWQVTALYAILCLFRLFAPGLYGLNTLLVNSIFLSGTAAIVIFHLCNAIKKGLIIKRMTEEFCPPISPEDAAKAVLEYGILETGGNRKAFMNKFYMEDYLRS